MTDKDEIIEQVNDFFNETHNITQGYVIPDVDDIGLDNEGKEIELAMLFIDINESTKIVDSVKRTTAVKIYKSFLWGVAKIARMNNGELRSFNGDGVLVAFIGDRKNNNSVKAAMQMIWFVREILKPKIQNIIANNNSLVGLDFSCGIGIDSGKILVIRGGIRGENNNDLVWVGNATNYAVKLSDLTHDRYQIYISNRVYTQLNDDRKLSSGTDMWEERSWTAMINEVIYRTTYHWSVG